MAPRVAALQPMAASNLLPRSAAIRTRVLEIPEMQVKKIQVHQQAHKIVASKVVISKLQEPAIVVVLKVANPPMAAVLQAIRAMATIHSAIYLQAVAR